MITHICKSTTNTVVHGEKFKRNIGVKQGDTSIAALFNLFVAKSDLSFVLLFSDYLVILTSFSEAL